MSAQAWALAWEPEQLAQEREPLVLVQQERVSAQAQPELPAREPERQELLELWEEAALPAEPVALRQAAQVSGRVPEWVRLPVSA